MILKLLFSSLIIFTTLYAKKCADYYNPNKFYDAPDTLSELIENSLNEKELKFFQEAKNYEKISFTKEEDYFIDAKNVTKFKEYRYPEKSGLWKYKIDKNRVDELHIAQVEMYRYQELEIANELNDTFDNFWSDWNENGYEMQLTPEQTLFRYNDKYFSFSVYIYGLKGDATPLKGTVVNYWFKDYTSQVNKYIKCMKDRNDS